MTCEAKANQSTPHPRHPPHPHPPNFLPPPIPQHPQLCYDLSDYDECFWDYRGNCFLPAKDVEQFDHILEAVYVTKGSFATDPVTHKTTETTALASGDVVAATTMQGWRIDNEDAHVVAPLTDSVTLSAVLDGHGGARVAAYAAPRLAGHLRAHLAPCLDSLSSASAVDTAAVEAGVVAAFLAADADIENNMSPAHCDAAGSTVNALLLTPHHYVCGNAGDSRLIVVREGGEVEKLSHDHKPESDEERGRVVSAGGRVVDGRVEGILAVSRAVGDFDFKQAGELDAAHQAVTAKPDVIVAPRRPTDRFLIQACDGIWDVVSDEEAAELVQAKLEEGASPAAAAEALCDHCLALELVESGIGTDNMSVNLIVLSLCEQKAR